MATTEGESHTITAEELAKLPPGAEHPDSIEKGVMLDFQRQLVHACKVREDMGCGITKCGFVFLLGHKGYRPNYTFDAPPREDSDNEWSKCKTCCERPDYEAVKRLWRGWKATAGRTWAVLREAANA